MKISGKVFTWGDKIRVIRQVETSECGIACLAMILDFYGHKLDLTQLRQRANLSARGSSLSDIIRIAADVGLSARALRCEPENLLRAKLPVILHWNMNHFVVLTRVSSRLKSLRYEIIDPANGSQTLSANELSSHFTGILLELKPSVNFQPINSRKRLRLRDLFSRTMGLRRSFGQIMTFSILLELFSLMLPLYMQIAVDSILPAFDLDLLELLAIGFAFVVLLSSLVEYLRSWTIITLSADLSYQIGATLFKHLLNLPVEWFERRHVGGIVSRFASVTTVAHLLSEKLISSLIDGALAIGTLALMYSYSVQLTELSLCTLVLHASIRLFYIRHIQKASEDMITDEAKESSILIESVRGVCAIKIFKQNAARESLWQDRKVRAINSSVILYKLNIRLETAARIVAGLENILFIYLAMRLVFAHSITLGMVFSYTTYKQQFLGAATRILAYAGDYAMLRVHLDRLSDIALADADSDCQPSISSRYQNSDSNAIELKNIRFSYSMSEPDIISDATATIKIGESVAIVGPSGGGKTTLIKIILGLLKPTEGEVFVNNINNKIENNYIHQVMTAVMQDDVLYAGSIAQNVSFFSMETDLKRVIECCKIAYINEDINLMPMKYETLVGDMGSALSGGQKQRILLARALYPCPGILIVDEGTANLDVIAEREVNQALCSLYITRIIIAHRPETIKMADRILKLENGCLFEDTSTSHARSYS